MKVFAVCVAWPNTKKNHAGMYHLASNLKKESQNNIVVISQPRVASMYFKPLNVVINLFIALYLLLKTQKGDIVFLMEYLLPVVDQSIIARIVGLRKNVIIIGLAHLVPDKLLSLYKKKDIVAEIRYLDRLIVLGQSLKDFISSLGVHSGKIIKTFHYVDNSYYYLRSPRNSNISESLKVICMGNMERDYFQLQDIISVCPSISFTICMGKDDISELFKQYKNVRLIGFVAEDELKKMMGNSDVSLNIMKDTIGSNVITTSMAMGLCMVASKVGSIEDYIGHDEGCLFESIDEVICFLHRLESDRELLYHYKRLALNKSKNFSISCFSQWLDNEIYKFVK